MLLTNLCYVLLDVNTPWHEKERKMFTLLKVLSEVDQNYTRTILWFLDQIWFKIKKKILTQSFYGLVLKDQYRQNIWTSQVYKIK